MASLVDSTGEVDHKATKPRLNKPRLDRNFPSVAELKHDRAGRPHRRGATGSDGKMFDRRHLVRAQRLLAQVDNGFVGNGQLFRCLDRRVSMA